MNWSSVLERQALWQPQNAEQFRLSEDEAVELYTNAPLHQLMSAAHQRRNAMHGGEKVTYLIDRNINYTNICTINCQFCSFYRPPGHEDTLATYQRIRRY
jgi:cyclic dehypoxanthinyl futalosine synthase